MNCILFLALLAMLLGCEENVSYDCNDIYDPVLGVDGKVYGNSCYASRDGVNVKHDLREYYWDATQCADPWRNGSVSENDVDLLEEYLEGIGIEIYSAYKIEGSDLNNECESCNCGAGYRYEFLANPDYHEELKSEGLMSYWD
jgi:hypothetical protein